MRAFLGLTSAVIALGGVVATASADVVGAGIAFTIVDVDTGETGTWTPPDNGQWNGDNYSWSTDETISITGNTTGKVLATLNPDGDTWGYSYFSDPQVTLNFAVQAGGANTVVMIGSALLSFPTISNAQAQASAAFSLTDTNGTGATLTGLAPGGGAYLADYNGFAPGGTHFASSIPAMAVGAFGTTNASDNVPAVGYTAIGAASDMSSLVHFSLSAFDLASGTSTFVIIPEPASLALLGLGALFAFRRR